MGKQAGDFADKVGSFDRDIGVFAEGIGQFDHDTVDRDASTEEVEADELLIEFRHDGMNARLALKVAQRYAEKEKRRVGVWVSQKENENGAKLVVMDSLQRADSQEHLWQTLCSLIESPKTKFSVGCLMLAMGRKHKVVGSERDWAKDRMVSPTHVSNEVKRWQQILGLPQTEFQKSAQAVEAYRARNQPRKAG